MRREFIYLVLVVGVGLTVVVSLAIILETRALDREAEIEIQRRLQSVREAIAFRINEHIHALEFMAADYAAENVADAEGHAALGRRLIRQFGEFTSVSYIDPDLIIRRIYPFEGFEPIIGKDLGKDPGRRRAIEQALASGRPMPYGPVELTVGGNGLIIYTPIPGRRELLAGVFRVEAKIRNLFEQLLGPDTPFTLASEDGGLFFKSARPLGPRVRTVEIPIGVKSWTMIVDVQNWSAGLNARVTVWPLVGAMGALTVILGGLGLLYLSRLREIERLYAEIRRAAVEREQLTEFLVHDLKNPINAILGYLDLLSESAPETARGYIDNSRMAARELTKMVRNILEVARLREGKLVPERQKLTLLPLMHQKAREYRGLAESAGTELRVDPAAGDVSAVGDPNLTDRVLENLISNALRYTPRGGTVTLSARAEGAVVTCIVTDTGPGIPEEFRERLFKRFEPPTPPKLGRGSASTGLGLAFCRLAVEAQGGRIWIESPDSGGTRVLFTLPSGA